MNFDVRKKRPNCLNGGHGGGGGGIHAIFFVIMQIRDQSRILILLRLCQLGQGPPPPRHKEAILPPSHVHLGEPNFLHHSHLADIKTDQKVSSVLLPPVQPPDPHMVPNDQMTPWFQNFQQGLKCCLVPEIIGSVGCILGGKVYNDDFIVLMCSCKYCPIKL